MLTRKAAGGSAFSCARHECLRAVGKPASSATSTSCGGLTAPSLPESAGDVVEFEPGE
jgi:hypothetical protein